MTVRLLDNLIYEGRGIPFEAAPSEIGKIVSLLFSRPNENATEGLFSRHNIKNVLWTTSPAYLTNFQAELQRVLLHAFENREGVNDELFTLFVHQTLSLLPFAYPLEGFAIQVPVKIAGEWELKNYTVNKKFELANQILASPMPAYGLISANGGPPLLVFMGTTYPAGEGFLGTLFSDFTPGLSTGGLPMLCGKAELGAWLQEHTGAYAMGISLGGALSLHAAKHFGAHIAKVFAFVPPGLYPSELRAFENSPTEINLLFQDGDHVSSFGFFPEGENVKLYHIYEQQRANGLSAHARVFLSGTQLKVYRGSPSEQNQLLSRKILTGLHMFLSSLLFILLLPAYLLVSLFKLIKRALLEVRTTVVFPSQLPYHE